MSPLERVTSAFIPSSLTSTLQGEVGAAAGPAQRPRGLQPLRQEQGERGCVAEPPRLTPPPV